MTSRYVALPLPPPPPRPRADTDGPAPSLPHPTVYPSELVATGLVDADGRAIYRLPDPLGYLPLPRP